MCKIYCDMKGGTEWALVISHLPILCHRDTWYLVTGWVAGVMMGGALGWCQHPALGGNQEKWGHGCGPAPTHHQFQVSPCLTQRKSWREKLDTWLRLIKTIHFVFLIIINSANNYPWRETIVLEIMSLGAEIDHDPCIEWWQHPIRHKYSSLMWGSVVIMHCAVREIARRLDTAKSEREADTRTSSSLTARLIGNCAT